MIKKHKEDICGSRKKNQKAHLSRHNVSKAHTAHSCDHCGSYQREPSTSELPFQNVPVQVGLDEIYNSANAQNHNPFPPSESSHWSAGYAVSVLNFWFIHLGNILYTVLQEDKAS